MHISRAGSLCIVSLATIFAALLFSIVNADSSTDFTTDVQRALSDTRLHPSSSVDRDTLTQAEYTSTWDEFGTSPQIDGTTPSSEINAAIAQDVAGSVASEQGYDQTEVAYLESIHSSPEQVIVSETKAGSDVPPGEDLNPNPSLEANPDVNPTTAEDISAETVAAAAVETGTPAAGAESAGGGGATQSTSQDVYQAVISGTDISANAQDGTTAAISPEGAVSGDAPQTGTPGATDSTTDTSNSDTSAPNSSASDTGSSDGEGDSTGSDSGASAVADAPASAAIAQMRAAKTLDTIFNALFAFFRGDIWH